ncbi:hypothetical protein N7G274_008411 [Stereocaulon virgatum]|uniref:Uncharacterized protein n=1 Tax=Stereocaulon virgatum TaxID=373712 RepID=A0ABR4A080_9LECA
MNPPSTATTRSAGTKHSVASLTGRSTRSATKQQEREAETKRVTIFQFMKLPPELRWMIYAQALAAGTTSILRLSKRVYAEAQQCTYTSAFLQLNLQGVFGGWGEHEDKDFVPWLNVPNLDFIQNVHFDVDYKRLYPGHVNIRRLKAFHQFLGGAGSVQRKTCNITLRNTSFHTMHYTAGLGQDMLNIVGSLTDFENVFFMASRGSPRPLSHRLRGTGNALVPANDRYDKYNDWMSEEMYSLVKQFLEVKLGPATYQTDVRAGGGGYLTFRPRKTVD